MNNQNVAEQPSQTKIKRPIGVWIVLTYCLLLLMGSSYGHYMQATGKQMIPGIDVRMTPFDYFQSLVIMAALFAAGTTLFFMKKVAYKLFCSFFILTALGMVWTYYARGYSNQMSLWSVASGLIIPAIVCAYIRDLNEKGILR